MIRLTPLAQPALGLAVAALLAGPGMAQSNGDNASDRRGNYEESRNAYDDNEHRFFSDAPDPDDEPGEFGPDKGDLEVLITGSGSNDQDFDTGAGAFELSLGYYVVEEVIVGHRQGVGIAGTSTGDDIDDSDFDVTGSTVGFVDYVFDLGRFRPFAGATFGYLYGEGIEDSFIAGPEAGLKFYVLDETFIIARVAYEFIFEDVDDADSNFEDGRFNYTLGVGFNF